MKNNLLFICLVLLVVSLNSCADSATSEDFVLKSIPQEVSMVTAIDADAILEKADFEQVKKMAFYQELVNETKKFNTTLGDVLENPSASGLDLTTNVYMAHHFDPNNPEEIFIGVVAAVKDKVALEKLIESNSKLKISKHGNFDVAMSGSQSVSWNDELVVLGMTNSYSDPITKIEKFFNTTEETAVTADPNLSKAINGKHDIASWLSTNAFAKSPMLKNILIMASIDANAIQDNYIHSYVDFNDGAIEARSNLFLQDALMADINLLFKDKVTTDFSTFIPSSANSVMTLALDFEGVQQMLSKRPQASMMIDFGLKEYGLSVDDIASTFGGDILLYSTSNGDLASPGSFATTIKDMDKFGKFLQLATDYKILDKIDDKTYSINNSKMLAGGRSLGDAELLILDDLIFISADPTSLEAVKSGGFRGDDRIDASKIKAIGSNILAGFINYEDLLKSVSGTKDLNVKFKDMEFTTNRKDASFDMNFQEKNVNSLKQLFESINEIYLANKNGSI
jgi:hypothetical protein